jgi:hypothetical protein
MKKLLLILLCLPLLFTTCKKEDDDNLNPTLVEPCIDSTCAIVSYRYFSTSGAFDIIQTDTGLVTWGIPGHYITLDLFCEQGSRQYKVHPYDFYSNGVIDWRVGDTICNHLDYEDYP